MLAARFHDPLDREPHQLSSFVWPTVTSLELSLRSGSSRVAGRRLSDEAFEVANEVGLIRIPKAGRKVGPVAWFVCRGVLCCVVETVALDDPLRADADVFTEKPLQGALAQAREAHDIIDLRDFTFVGDGVHDAKHGIRIDVTLRALR